MSQEHEGNDGSLGGGGAPPVFSQLVRAARLGNGWSQQQLASRLDKTKQWINAIEKNDLPSLEQVVRLHDELLDERLHRREPERTRSLGFWLLTWLAQHSERNTPDIRERVSRVLHGALPMFPDALMTGRPRMPSPLCDFPSAFDRLTVIAGDRREVPAHSGGDLFAASASVLDLRYLNRLRFGLRDVTIWHDKVFTQMPEDYLRQQFGKSHLLVVGSPAVNLAARRINSQSLFRFNVSAEARAWEAQARTTFPRPDTFSDQKRLAVDRNRGIFRLQDRLDVELVDAVLRAVERGETFDPETHLNSELRSWFEHDRQGVVPAAEGLLRGCKPSEWTTRFRSREIVDPADGRLQGLDDDSAKRLYEDLGVVSVGANPFADEDDGYVSILVAGIHGPGTAHALKALAEADFTHRSMGGVLRIRLVPDVDLPQRVIQAAWEWVTEPYDLEKVVQNLTEQPANFAGEWGNELDDWIALPGRLLKALGANR